MPVTSPRVLRPTLPRALAVIAATVISGSSCAFERPSWWPGATAADESPLLARVGDRELRASAIGGLVVPGTAPADSIRAIREYVERWTREASVLNHAAADIGSDPTLEKLVADYRASLQRHRLEERLLTEGVDTVVTVEELEARYAAMAESYPAPHDLVRAVMLKVPRGSEAIDQLDAAWRRVDDAEIPAEVRQLAGAEASLVLLDPRRWFEAAELEALLPVGSGDIRVGSRVTDTDDHRYYLRVLERVSRGARSPLAYLEPRLRKMILEERRASYLEAYVDQVYHDAQANEEIEIYVGREP